MALLTSKTRNKLSKKEFGLPESRKYPVDTRARAGNAKARASEMEHKGKLSESSKARIDAKANRILDAGKRGSKSK
jgi:hypothetical protein